MRSCWRLLLPVLALASLMAGAAVDARQQAPAEPYTPPRTPDGQPDIQGIYNPVGTFYNIEDLEYQSLYQNFTPNPSLRGKSLIIDPADGKIPYQAWAAEKRKPIYQLHGDPTPGYVDPNARCWPQGVPRHVNNREFEIFQPPGHVVIFNMAHHTYRVIPVDGSPHIPENVKLWLGDSRGRWEGNTLVVDVTNNNDQTWFDVMASFHSDAMRVTERFTPVSPDRIEYRAVITDPKVYTRPWTFAIHFNRNKDYGSELYEEACVESNERNLELLKRPGR
ncbi:MAG: hypothetical protein HYY76_02955 [Acidobacteria bacterium]|nr:hypothetical protein [Acidobacteriota bacterium]